MKKIITLIMASVLSISLFAEKLYVCTNAEFVPYEYLKSMKTLKTLDKITDNYPGASIALKKGSLEKVEKINKILENLKNTNEYNNLVIKYFPEKNN